MKIKFACDDGSYVVEIFPGRLYAKVHPDKGHPPLYDGNYNLLLNPGSFHEYREKDQMLENRIADIIHDEFITVEKEHKK